MSVAQGASVTGDENTGNTSNTQHTQNQRQRTALEASRDDWMTMLDGYQAHQEAESQAEPTAAEIVLTEANLLNNLPVGDVPEEKQAYHTRVYFSNFNGFQLDEEGGKFEGICKEALNIQDDIVCGVKQNTDTIKN